VFRRLKIGDVDCLGDVRPLDDRLAVGRTGVFSSPEPRSSQRTRAAQPRSAGISEARR
jgi:hypothetical protein